MLLYPTVRRQAVRQSMPQGSFRRPWEAICSALRRRMNIRLTMMYRECGRCLPALRLRLSAHCLISSSPPDTSSLARESPLLLRYAPGCSSKIASEHYDTIILGYPSWIMDLPMPVYSFLEEYDFGDQIKYIVLSVFGIAVRQIYISCLRKLFGALLITERLISRICKPLQCSLLRCRRIIMISAPKPSFHS